MNFGWFLLLLLLVGQQTQATSVGRVRRDDGVPAGKCCSFWFMRFEGNVFVAHFYVCCNNADDDDDSCDGKTYDSASDTAFCGKGGKDLFDGNKGKCFDCDGCANQDKVMNTCIKYTDVGGLCWAFVECFNFLCKFGHLIPAGCFNGVCEPGENTDNCPADCCGNVNPSCKPIKIGSSSSVGSSSSSGGSSSSSGGSSSSSGGSSSSSGGSSSSSGGNSSFSGGSSSSSGGSSSSTGSSSCLPKCCNEPSCCRRSTVTGLSPVEPPEPTKITAVPNRHP